MSAVISARVWICSAELVLSRHANIACFLLSQHVVWGIGVVCARAAHLRAKCLALVCIGYTSESVTHEHTSVISDLPSQLQTTLLFDWYQIILGGWTCPESLHSNKIARSQSATSWSRVQARCSSPFQMPWALRHHATTRLCALYLMFVVCV